MISVDEGATYEYVLNDAGEKIKAAGGKVTREAGPVKGGTSVIAFVEDPDGYKVELIQRDFEGTMEQF